MKSASDFTHGMIKVIIIPVTQPLLAYSIYLRLRCGPAGAYMLPALGLIKESMKGLKDNSSTETRLMARSSIRV